jgi:hypothetical protein
MTFAGRLTPAQRAERTRRGQEQFQRELAAQAEAEARRLAKAYLAQLKRLDAQLGLAKLAENGALYNTQAIERLRRQVQTTLDGLSGQIEAVSRAAEAGGVAVGTRAGAKAMQDTVGVSFNQPSVEQIRSLVGYVDSPAFQASLANYGAYHGEQAADIILDGASRGVDPIKTARQVRQYVGKMPMFDALRTVRTVQLYSARQGSHEIYRANADVISGWMWSSALQRTTCMACRSQHGKVFPLDKALNDHHLGKCAPVPVTRRWSDFGFSSGSEVLDGVPTGIQLFERMSQAEQIAAMGKAAYMAWKDGGFNLEQYAMPYQNAVYGTMVGEASLEQLVGVEVAQAYARQARAA